MRAWFAASAAFGAIASAHGLTYTGSGFTIADSDGTNYGVSSSTIAVSGTGSSVASVDSVTLTGLTHTYIGDLEIALTNGSTSVDLSYASSLDWSNFDGTYTFVVNPSLLTAEEATLGAGLGDDDVLPSGSYAIATESDGVNFGTRTDYAAFAGQSLDESWTLVITDTSAGDTGTLGSWSLNVTPQAVPEPASWLACVLGSLGLCLRRRRQA